jgi:hypothetical protein
MAVYRKNKELLAKHPLLARASNFEGETLVVVHENDELVPSETTDAYINAFNADHIVAKGFPHSFNDAAIDYVELIGYQNKIVDWLQQP